MPRASASKLAPGLWDEESGGPPLLQSVEPSMAKSGDSKVTAQPPTSDSSSVTAPVGSAPRANKARMATVERVRIMVGLPGTDSQRVLGTEQPRCCPGSNHVTLSMEPSMPAAPSRTRQPWPTSHRQGLCVANKTRSSMRWWWPLLLVGALPALGGCLSPHHQSIAVEPLPEAIMLPPGIRFAGADMVRQNDTVATAAWSGSVDGGLDLPVVFPGTHPLSLLAEAKTGNVAVHVVDEYGATRCSGTGKSPCEVREVAQLGWERQWVVRLSESGSGAVQASLLLTVTLGEGQVVQAVQAAGISRIDPVEVAAADGAKLRGSVYIPRGPGPFATLLEFSPYPNGAAGTFTDEQAISVGDRQTIRHSKTGPLGILLDAGFAVALVNLRG